MKTHSYEKVIKQFLILLLLLFTSPVILSVALKAKRIYVDDSNFFIGYILLGIACILLIFTVFYGFKTFKTLRKTIFEE